MFYKYLGCFLMFLIIFMTGGCSKYQPTKNVWKTTKGLWSTYVSPPASVDYENKGHLSPQIQELSREMMGVDTELTKLERIMQNADKPPTQEWLDRLFASFPWLDGFAGIKYDGTILGQQPEGFLKELDFNPLLYEDKKQSSRALRADIQPSPLGPEIMLATPLYDGIDFLGIVVSYFDMRSLMKFAENASNIVVLSPTALLWPGKYDFASTPLAGVDWAKVVTESTAGSCSNANGSFFYMVRFLGNLPLIFAVPEKGDFAAGDGSLEQGVAFFPQEREKMPPPDLPERKPRKSADDLQFAQRENEELSQPDAVEPQIDRQAPVASEDSRPSPNEIHPGSNESVLLKSGGKSSGRQIQERQLEGENVEVERVERRRAPVRRPVPEIIIDEPEITPEPQPEIARPSPFGPRDKEPAASREEREYSRPSPFGPRDTEPADSQTGTDEPLADGEISAPASQPAPQVATPAPAPTDDSTQEDLADGEKAPTETRQEPARLPARMPDGRPSPFGPAE